MTTTSPPSFPTEEELYAEDLRRFDPDVMREAKRAETFEQLLGIVPRRFHKALPEDLIGDLATWSPEQGAFIAGPVGSGKTHQAAALVLKHWESFWSFERAIYYGSPAPWFDSELAIRWENVPLMLEQIRKSFDYDDVAPDDCQNAGLLVLDDLGAEKPSPWVEERLYCIINYRYENSLPTIVTSNMGLTALGESIGQRTASRIGEMCRGFLLDSKDRRRGGGAS